ncbi:MAG: PEGA domain-containing protein [Deltaproteobacteria bacterium]|nr:PEGA domain-containing protein [Deltaproteobacteria bacterium]
MAEIYRARTIGIGGFEKYCAIKKILPHLNENQEFITMLIDEAKICVSLQHSNIVQVFDLGKISDSYFIAMEYVHGMDLATILKTCAYNNFVIPFEYTVHIGMQVCAALYHAHSQRDSNGELLGIIHRDVSPHNILISYDGEVKIIDFGVAKASIKMTHTMSGIIKGKLLYMAPEQAMAKEIDLRADLFSLGLVLYKMTTHQLPFEGENEFQIYNKLVQGKVVPPKKLNPKVPDSLDEVIGKSLRKRPQERFQDGFEFRNSLAQVLNEICPGYTSSKLAQFMETYFPPRPLVNPEPQPEMIESLEVSVDSLELSEDEDLLTSAPLAGREQQRHGPGGAAAAQAGGAAPERRPSGAMASPAPRAEGGPLGAGHRAGPRHSGMIAPIQPQIGQHDQTVRVSVPFGVSLLNQETVPASAGLLARDLFPEGFPGLDAGLDAGPPDPSLRLPRHGLALKIALGVVIFLALLLSGIFGGYHLLEMLTRPQVAVTFTPSRPAATGAEQGAGPAKVSGSTAAAAGPLAQAGTGREVDGGTGEGEGAGAGAADGGAGTAAAPAGDEAAAAAASSGSSEGQVTITLDSIPEGAEVYQDSVYVGPTKIVLSKKRKEGAKIRFTLRKEGFREYPLIIPLDKDQKFLVRLKRN